MIKLNTDPIYKFLYVLFLLLIPASIFRVNASIPGYESLFLFRILLIVILVGLFLLFLINRDLILDRLNELKNDKFVALFFIFWMLFGLVSYFWIEDFTNYFRYNVLLLLSFLFTFVVVFFIRDKETLIFVWKILLVTFAVALFVAVLEIFTNFRLMGSTLVNSSRSYQLFATSFFNHPNDFASYISLTLPFLLLLPLLTGYDKFKWWALSFITLSLFVLTFTGSRINYFTAIVTLVLTLILIRIKKIRQTVAYLTIGVVAIFSLLPVLGPDIANKILSTVNRTINQVSYTSIREGSKLEEAIIEVVEGQGSAEVRKNLTLNSLEIMKENPESIVIGLGAGQVEEYMEDYTNTKEVTSLHNWWLEVLANHGIFIGVTYLLFYLWLLREVFIKAKKTKDNFLMYFNYSVTLALIIVLFTSLSPSSSLGFAPLWLTFGLALAAKNL